MNSARRIACLIVIFILMTVFVPCNAETGACFEIDYTRANGNAIDLISESGDVNYWVKNKALHIETKSSDGGSCDPFVLFDVEIPDAASMCWLKICIKNKSAAPKLRFDFGEGSIVPASCSLLDISAEDSEYKTYIVNMKTINEETLPISSMFGLSDASATESVWQGHVNQFRIGLFFTDFPGGNVSENLNADIAYIGFFGTQAEAKERAVRLPSDGKDRSKILTTVFIAVLIVILVFAILKYGSESGKNGKKNKKSGKSKNTKSNKKG